MELKSEIIKKYNVLLLEALQFYKHEDCIGYFAGSNASGMAVILNYKIGYRANSQYGNFINFLKKKYPYLTPFEEFNSLYFNNELQSNTWVLREINEVIQQTREQNDKKSKRII